MSRNPCYIRMIQSTKWRKLRNKKITAEPRCERCLELQRITLATEVHHKEPVETGITYTQMHQLMFDYTNLMSVCHHCHIELHKGLNSFSRETVQKNNKRYTKRFIDKFL